MKLQAWLASLRRRPWGCTLKAEGRKWKQMAQEGQRAEGKWEEVRLWGEWGREDSGFYPR